MGSVLVKRGQPCIATPSGALLCQHAERVQLMEAELGARLPSMPGSVATVKPSFHIAVNDDSLSTWFLESVSDFCVEREILLDLVIDDQDHTVELIRHGSVQGAITTQSDPVQGWKSTHLGKMRYLAVCSPDFFVRHFSDGISKSSLSKAPQVNFNSKDELQKRFIQRITRGSIDASVHQVPHGMGFLRACTSGMAWGMCPSLMVEPLLDCGKLVELNPAINLEVDLYWQSWKVSIKWLDDFGMLLAKRAAEELA
ncbi:LysR family transcriptional regulator [Burkholderia lata]|nr:LysR family transcriptional regulator [Burkholderia lata]